MCLCHFTDGVEFSFNEWKDNTSNELLSLMEEKRDNKAHEQVHMKRTNVCLARSF